MGKKILIVEDEKISCLFLAHQISELGHQVVGTAVTGDEAIRKAEELSPDLVVMDIGLKGGMSGAEAASVIEERLDIPILFVSAYTEEEVNRQERLPRTYAFLAKPVLAEDLQEAVENVLTRSQ